MLKVATVSTKENVRTLRILVVHGSGHKLQHCLFTLTTIVIIQLATVISWHNSV